MTTLLNLDPSQVPDDGNGLVYNAASKKWLPGAVSTPGPALPASATTAALQARVTENGRDPLTTPTYDGSGQGVHPSVAHIPGRLGGYEYWMAFTPYAGGNFAYENPSVLASHDGHTWVVPDGLTNPLKAKPSGANDFNSDPYLTHHENTLYLFYRSVEEAHAPLADRLYVTTSADGVTWQPEQLVYASNPTTARYVSPSFIRFGDQWLMYGVEDVGNPHVIHRRTATDLTGPWSAATTCTGLTTAAGYQAWHIDVHRFGDEYVMFTHETVAGGSTAGGHVRRSVSTDGIAWTSDPEPMMTGTWDHWDRSIYKTAGLPSLVNGAQGYRLWYSALKGTTWRIGHTLAHLEPRNKVQDAIVYAIRPVSPYIAGDDTRRADNAATPGSLTSGQAWVVANGTVGIESNRLRDIGASGGTATLDLGVTDYEIGMTVTKLPVVGDQVYLNAAWRTTTEFLRMGVNGTSAFAYDYFVNGSLIVSSQLSYYRAPATGDRIKLRVKSGILVGYVNELAILRHDLTAIAGNTKVAIQFTSAADARVTDFYAKRI